MLPEENRQPLTSIVPQDRERSTVIKPGLLAGGAEDEGVGQLHLPGQGGEGGRCRGVEGVTEGEHWESQAGAQQEAQYDPHPSRLQQWTSN